MKYKINYWIKIDKRGNMVFCAEIMVKGLFMWHVVTNVEDCSEQYVRDRALEIVALLEDPNR